MRTNLTIISAIMLAIASTGCTKSNVEDDSSLGLDPSKIAFRTSAAKTRANDNALLELKGGFNVIALDHAGEYLKGFTDPAADKITYFFNTGVTPNIWDWKNLDEKSAKVWPTEDISYPLSFYAAYPISSSVSKNASSVNANVLSNFTPATFRYNTYNNGAPIDFNAATLTIDELAALSQVETHPVTGFADLNFKHIMSNMKFNIIVPDKHEAYIHSIKIVNVNKSGRSYDYKTAKWSDETAYNDQNNTHFAHFIASAGQPVQQITKSKAMVDGLSDGSAGFHTLKLMPQKITVKWAPDKFLTDAAAWKASLPGGTIDAAAITKWHTQAVAAQGMSESEGWKGSRIEVIYCLVDKTAGAGKEKNIIGKKSGIEGAAQDLMVRVGYVLEIPTIDGSTGWQAGKRYTFSIPLGTANASNGILLDPDYKTNVGDNTDKPVDNPATEPGQEISKGGTIQFKVDVTDWADAPGVGVN